VYLLNDLDRNAHVCLLLGITNRTFLRRRLVRAAARATATAAATASRTSTNASSLATAAARLCIRQLSGSSISRRDTTAATTSVAAAAASLTAVSTASSTVWRTYASTLATRATFLRSSQGTVGDIFRSGTTAAARALLLGNRRGAKGEMNESDANENAHDRHCEQGIDKSQDENSRENEQLESTHHSPVSRKFFAAHASKNVRRKRRYVSEIFIKFIRNGSLDFGVVVDGLENTTFKTVLSSHLPSELREAAVKEKERSNTQDSIQNSESKECFLLALNHTLFVRNLNLIFFLHLTKRIGATRGNDTLFIGTHEAVVLAATKWKVRSMCPMVTLMKHSRAHFRQATSQAMAIFISLGLCLSHGLLTVLDEVLRKNYGIPNGWSFLGRFLFVRDRRCLFFFRTRRGYTLCQIVNHGIKDTFRGTVHNGWLWNCIPVGGTTFVD
jgi:hypothetical protein